MGKFAGCAPVSYYHQFHAVSICKSVDVMHELLSVSAVVLEKRLYLLASISLSKKQNHKKYYLKMNKRNKQ